MDFQKSIAFSLLIWYKSNQDGKLLPEITKRRLYIMKRIVSIALVVLMVAALFVGCSSNSVDGVYRIKTVNGKELKTYLTEELGGTEDQIEALLKMAGIDSLEDYMTITLNQDGTVKAAMMGEESEGTWKLDGEKLTLTVDGEATECTYKDGKITVDMDGETMVLGK